MSAEKYIKLCPSDKLSSRLYIQKQKGQFCDINLLMCDNHFPVHSCVISSSSCHVEKLLGSRNYKVMMPSLDVLIDFNTEEKQLFCKECAEKVLDFVYCCGIHVHNRHMPHIYALSKKLDIVDLSCLCKSYFASAGISPANIPLTSVMPSCVEANQDSAPSEVIAKIPTSGLEENTASEESTVDQEWTPIDSTNLSCPKCKDSFSNVTTLQQHCNTHFEKLYSCFVCSYSTLKVPHLLQHVKEANHMETVCSLCLFEAESNSKLQEHMKEHENAQPFFCRTCKNRFQTRTALNSHIIRHSTVTPFICTVCARGFKWKHGLQNHMFIHSSTKNHLCDECGYSTAHLKSFQDHKTIHSGIKFKCPISDCEFTSSRKESVKHHLSTHSKEKSYQCEVCGQAFSQAKNLRRHATIHDPGAEQEKCPLCSFKTMRSDKFRDHLRRCFEKSETPPRMKNKRVKKDKSADVNTVNMSEGNGQQAVSFTEEGTSDPDLDINHIVITTIDEGAVSLDQNPVNFVVCNADGSLAMDYNSISSEHIDIVDPVNCQYEEPLSLQDAVGSEVEIGSNESISKAGIISLKRYVNLDPIICQTMSDQNSTIISPQVLSSNVCLPLNDLSMDAVVTSNPQTDSLLVDPLNVILVSRDM